MNNNEYNQHTATLREAQLATSLIGSGIAALGNASFETVGYYHEAFFGISIGIERLCKLLIIADHVIESGGEYPSGKVIRSHGHDLHQLLDKCEDIASRMNPDRSFHERPLTPIHTSAIRVLTDFAKATRYYNLDFLTNSSKKHTDPVSAWWSEVGEPICALHYTDTARNKDEAKAALMGTYVGQIAHVIHTSETGEHINDMEELMTRAGATKVVQRYGRLYILQIVRWLSSVAYELSMKGGYEKQIAGLFCFHEPMAMFMNEDAYLRDRKTWPLYR